MVLVSRLLNNANKILDAAESLRVAGHQGADWSILIGAEGQIHMVAEGAAESSWPLDALRAEHGATEAYRVTQFEGRIEVQGKDINRDLLISSAHPNLVLRRLLPERRDYYTAS
jgi:hypothetical protein